MNNNSLNIFNAMKAKIGGFILLLILFSCSSEPNFSRKGKHIYPVDANRNDEVSVFDLFSKIEIIPLETNSSSLLTFPIGDPDRLVIKNNKFYFLDEKQNAVLIFDAKGKFINKIDKKGNGPGEYTLLSDFNINRFTGNLELLSARGYINVYDPLGNTFLEKIRLPFPAVHYFHHLTSDVYVFFSSAMGGEIYFYSKKESKRIEKNIYKLPKWFGQTVYSSSRNPFYVYNDSLHFEQLYNGDVFTISPVDFQLMPRYLWDFGKYNFDLSVMPENKRIEFYANLTKKMSNKYVNFFQIYSENRNHYFTRFKFKNRYKHLILDKKTNKYLLFDQFKEGLECLPLGIDDKAMYTVLSPFYLDKIVNTSVLDEKNQKLYSQIKDTDNPVVVKYTFK